MAKEPRALSLETDPTASTQTKSPARRTKTQGPAIDPNAARSTVSFYFTEAATQALEAAWSELRTKAKGQGVKVSAVSKSAIVDLAVQWACADLEERGDKSALAQLLKQ